MSAGHQVTPDAVRPYGVKVERGPGRKVPRFIFAYTGRQKLQFLSAYTCLTVQRVLPEYGGNYAHVRSLPQTELAADCGLAARETFTRWLSHFSQVDATITDVARQQQSQRSRDRAQKLGKTVRSQGAGPRRRPLALIFNRQQRRPLPNVLTLALPRTETHDPERYRPEVLGIETEQALRPDFEREPEKHREALRSLNARAGLRQYFSVEQIPAKQRYKHIPAWVWDSRVPITNTARVVYTYYCFCGLRDANPDTGKPWGRIPRPPRQQRIARECGISVRSVHRANQELEGKAKRWIIRDPQTDLMLGWYTTLESAGRAMRGFQDEKQPAEMSIEATPPLVRIVASPRIRQANGTMLRGPSTVLDLTALSLSSDEALLERKRMQEAVRNYRDRRDAQADLDAALGIHQGLLAAWTGKEHRITAFWHECRRQMLAAGIRRRIIRGLIPRPPG